MRTTCGFSGGCCKVIDLPACCCSISLTATTASEADRSRPSRTSPRSPRPSSASGPSSSSMPSERSHSSKAMSHEHDGQYCTYLVRRAHPPSQSVPWRALQSHRAPSSNLLKRFASIFFIVPLRPTGSFTLRQPTTANLRIFPGVVCSKNLQGRGRGRRGGDWSPGTPGQTHYSPLTSSSQSLAHSASMVEPRRSRSRDTQAIVHRAQCASCGNV